MVASVAEHLKQFDSFVTASDAGKFRYLDELHQKLAEIEDVDEAARSIMEVATFLCAMDTKMGGRPDPLKVYVRNVSGAVAQKILSGRADHGIKGLLKRVRTMMN